MGGFSCITIFFFLSGLSISSSSLGKVSVGEVESITVSRVFLSKKRTRAVSNTIHGRPNLFLVALVSRYVLLS